MLEQKVLDKVSKIGEGIETKAAVLLTGDTYLHKNTIKDMGGTWSREMQGWFVPLENLLNNTANGTPEPELKPEPEPEPEQPAAKNKGLKLTKAQRRKGMSIWEIKLERLVFKGPSIHNWETEEVMLESELVAKTPQQVKIRATKLIGKEHPDLEFSLSCADTPWTHNKETDQFRRKFGISAKYRITVW